jgi:predicted Zn-dependent protease with MMP-like domain
VPVSLSRSEQFEELVVSSVARLERRWGDQLDAIEVAVEDVPDPDLLPPAVPPAVAVLGRTDEAADGRPARIVVYRRAVEARAGDVRARETLVHEVVVERLAELLGLDPAVVDPEGEAEA